MAILKGLPILVAKVSNNRLVPENFEQREILHMRTGELVPLWMRKLARGDKTVWLPTDNVILVTLPTHTKGEKDTNSHS